MSQNQKALWDNAKEVVQGWGEAASSGYLSSYSFVQCGAVILYNQDAHCSLLMHLDQESVSSIAHNHIGRNVKSGRYDLFMAEPGKKIAQPINGSLSYDRSKIYEKMKERGVEVLQPIEVETGKSNWNLLFSADNGEIMVNNLASKEIHVYTPFLGKFSESEKENECPNAIEKSFKRYDLITSAKENINIYLKHSLSKLDIQTTKSVLAGIGKIYLEPEVQKTLFNDFRNGHLFNSFKMAKEQSDIPVRILNTIDLLKEFATEKESLTQVIFAYRNLAEGIECMPGLPFDTAFIALDHATEICDDKDLQRIIDQQRNNLLRRNTNVL